MKIYKATEREIDSRLRLDKRCDARAFFRNFDSEAELPVGFYDLQNQIRDGLEAKFDQKFDNGAHGETKLFYFPADLLIAELLGVELSWKMLDDRLIGLMLSFLDGCSAQYCIIGAVYKWTKPHSQFLGRFVVNRKEIAVEETLCDVWSKQVTLLEIQN